MREGLEKRGKRENEGGKMEIMIEIRGKRWKKV